MSNVRLRSPQNRHIGVSGSMANDMAAKLGLKTESKTTCKADFEWAQYLGLDDSEDDTPPTHPQPVDCIPIVSTATVVSPSEASVSNLQLKQSVKRKASSDSIAKSMPLKASRRGQSSHNRDTIMIDGEIYDRRRRPGSIAGLDLQIMPSLDSSYSQNVDFSIGDDFLAAYRSPQTSSVVSLALEQSPSPRLRRCQGIPDFGSEASFATATSPLSPSLLGTLNSPIASLALSKSLPSRPTPKSRHTAPPKTTLTTAFSSAASPNFSSTAAFAPYGLDYFDLQTSIGGSSVVDDIITIPEASPKAKGKKPKRERKRAPAKGTPQPAMGATENGSPVHITRPPNAFILYRSDQLKRIRADPMISKKPQADISKLIGALWREERAEVKSWYEQQAEVKKEEHQLAHPDYRYSPQKKVKKAQPFTADKLIGLPKSTSSSTSGASTIEILQVSEDKHDLPTIDTSASASALTMALAQSNAPNKAFLSKDMGAKVGSSAPTAKFIPKIKAAASVPVTTPTTALTDFSFDEMFQPTPTLDAYFPMDPTFSPSASAPISYSMPSFAQSTAESLSDDIWQQLINPGVLADPESVSQLNEVTSPSFSQPGSDTPSWAMTDRTLSSDSNGQTTPLNDVPPMIPHIFQVSNDEQFDWSNPVSSMSEEQEVAAELLKSSPFDDVAFNWQL